MYLDAAILVKLVVREEDSLFYADQVEGQSNVWTSALGLTECFSVLCRKTHDKEITKKTRDGAWLRVEQYVDSGMLRIVSADSAVLVKARRILDICYRDAALRSLDAMHLASCEHAAAWPLLTNDRKMRAAARLLKYALGPVA